jgi:hypothetical protein
MNVSLSFIFLVTFEGAATLGETTLSIVTLSAGNTKRGSITVLLTSCLTGFD